MSRRTAQAPGSWTGALVAGHDADAYQVRGVPAAARHARVVAVNTTDGRAVVIGHRSAGAAGASTPCRSRADWGADEGLRTSTRSYAPAQVLTVHHTGTDNADAAADPDALVRAIYSVHIQGNGWDDIGYQALIAPGGALYEGRWSGSTSRSCVYDGGDGTDFGHESTDPGAEVVTGAHTGGYNTGNYGVSLLGTYTEVAPAPAARHALVAHLAELAQRHGMDPTGSVAYDNGTNAGVFDTISGHRDFAATPCPGGVLYADLPAVRTDVATAMAGTEPPPDAEGTASGDRDDFTFEVSAAGATWTAVLTVAAGSDTAHTGSLPAGMTGSLRVRVTDTARIAGAATPDTITIDHLAVVPDGSAPTESPSDDGSTDPGADDDPLVLSASGHKVKGAHVVALDWVGATSVVLHRDDTTFAVEGAAFTDDIGAKGSATYSYRWGATAWSGVLRRGRPAAPAAAGWWPRRSPRW